MQFFTFVKTKFFCKIIWFFTKERRFAKFENSVAKLLRNWNCFSSFYLNLCSQTRRIRKIGRRVSFLKYKIRIVGSSFKILTKTSNFAKIWILSMLLILIQLELCIMKDHLKLYVAFTPLDRTLKFTANRTYMIISNKIDIGFAQIIFPMYQEFTVDLATVQHVIRLTYELYSMSCIHCIVCGAPLVHGKLKQTKVYSPNF